jgi:GTPase
LFFERPEGGETSVLVHIDLDSEREQEDPVEFEELVRSSGADPVLASSQAAANRRTPVLLWDQGKLEEIAELLCVSTRPSWFCLITH